MLGSRIPMTEGKVLLSPTDLAFESQAVLNPACIEVDGLTHMYYRAVRPGNYSTIGYCQVRDGKVVYRHPEPILTAEHEYERHGVEDPRIIQCEGTYYLVYTAFDGRNARIAYATSTDMRSFEKRGLISTSLPYGEVIADHKEAEWTRIHDFFDSHHSHEEDLILYEKDAFLFPEKINGRYALVHRIAPEIQVIYFDDFSELTDDYWRQHVRDLESHTILQPRYWFESRHIGGGCPPILTEHGWLLIYHAVEQRDGGRIYHAAAALLDKDDPTKILGRLPYPLFSPEAEWELTGDVGNVVFPSGAVVNGDDLKVYYGGADSCIASRELSLSDLLDELLMHPETGAEKAGSAVCLELAVA